jgi:outer membrane receptor protein involved in Fe transport
VETGWQFKKDDTTYLVTAYYRYRYHGVTEVSRYIDATTLLTTKENVGTSRSGGLELGATTRLGDRVALNFSGNVYRNEIDASNLGFSARSATMAWDAKLNLSWDVSKATLVQTNANYTAKRLTPQGYRYPAYFANIGLRHNFKDRRFAAVVSLSDIFDSLRERTHIDTPLLRQEIVRRRSSRTVYIGFIYDFGKPAKKQKDAIQFDTAP